MLGTCFLVRAADTRQMQASTVYMLNYTPFCFWFPETPLSSSRPGRNGSGKDKASHAGATAFFHSRINQPFQVFTVSTSESCFFLTSHLLDCSNNSVRCPESRALDTAAFAYIRLHIPLSSLLYGVGCCPHLGSGGVYSNGR